MAPRSRITLAVVLFWLSGSAPAPLARGSLDGVSEPAGRTPVLSISVDAGYRGQASASGWLALLQDQWSTAILTSQKGCGTGFSSAAPGATPALPDGGEALDSGTVSGQAVRGDNAVVWTISARLVNTRDDLVSIDLRWQRAVRGEGLDPNHDLSVETAIELTEGTTSVLDLVRGDAARGQCESVAVQIGLKFVSSSYVADAAISYDMWLVQRDADGRETVDRFRSVGRQGKSLDFFFRKLPYAKNGTLLDRTTAAPVAMRIGGLVTGAASTTGMIELTLDAQRLFEAGHLAVGTSGRKRLSVRSGETVEFEVPAPVRGGLAGVGDLEAPFGQMRTAIRVTPKVLWSEPRRPD